jgi:serine/threonine protein kinase
MASPTLRHGLADASPWPIPRSRTQEEEFIYTYCGTPQFLAPEMFESHSYTKAIDIWALGVIGILLLEGELPEMKKFGNSTYPDTLFGKVAEMYAKDPKNRLVILVRQMLAMHPEDRPGSTCLPAPIYKRQQTR